MTELARFGISIEQRLLVSFDQMITDKGYDNRSEAIRDMIRDALVEEQVNRADDTPTVGTVTLVYDHHTRDLSESRAGAGRFALHLCELVDHCIQRLRLPLVCGNLRHAHRLFHLSGNLPDRHRFFLPIRSRNQG